MRCKHGDDIAGDGVCALIVALTAIAWIERGGSKLLLGGECESDSTATFSKNDEGAAQGRLSCFGGQLRGRRRRGWCLAGNFLAGHCRDFNIVDPGLTLVLTD